MSQYSNTFLHMISRGIYRGLFQNRFLNLSLISRFPLYVHFPATVRGNRLSGAYSPRNNILFKIVPCDTVATRYLLQRL